MPTGVGANTLANDPRAGAIQFVTDPGAFFELTEKKVFTPIVISPTPGSGVSRTVDFPASGIIAMIRVIFDGDLTTTDGTGAVTTSDLWPYGLLDEFVLGTGASTDVIRVSGQQLHALKAVRNPGFIPQDTADVIPDGIGAAIAITTGANPITLTWDVPVAIDPVSLIGALYSQSANLTVQARIREAVITDLLTVSGNATIDSLTGTWFMQVTSFEVPIAGEDAPKLVVPDLSRLHGIHSHRVQFSNTGDVRAPLIRRNGQLDRLLFRVFDSTPEGAVTSQLLRGEADAIGLDRVRLEYGGSETPLDYNPTHFLASQNVADYADALPDGFYALDFLIENAPRDVILMSGVTDLTLIPTVASGATVAGGARVEVVQESLFAPTG
ncbi:hypothetical protein LCGC14_1711880 [marine sediment metagenome]|uniref:Uncharacterized protein n=1 Tax=marine sediment metagenome TaxID=412755 RepID=A0A0F9HFG2_9ZZZZ